jgi:hypothetical protein
VRRSWVALLLPVAVAACGLVPVGGDRAPVPAGPLGPVFPGEGGAPAVECRGVPVDQCRSFVSLDERNVVRVIVTCTAACTPQQGEVRIDVVRPDGLVEPRGQGSYASAPAAAPPAPTE